MTKAIIYGGQGNIQLKHLYQMMKTKKGQKLLMELEKCDQESYELMQKILVKKVDLNDIHAAMLSNFLYNEWLTNYEEIYPNIIFSAHSAGIFNVLLASKSAEFKNIIWFIKKRSQLIKELGRTEELWLLMTENLGMFYQNVLEPSSEKVKLAIVTNEISGVVAMKEEDVRFLDENANSEGYLYKIKELGVKAPYHTSFLNDSLKRYEVLVKKQNIVKNDSYNYIFHCEDLSDELIYQWDNVFNWKGILEKVVENSREIIDLTPNKFITKQLQKMKKRERENG